MMKRHPATIVVLLFLSLIQCSNASRSIFDTNHHNIVQQQRSLRQSLSEWSSSMYNKVHKNSGGIQNAIMTEVTQQLLVVVEVFPMDIMMDMRMVKVILMDIMQGIIPLAVVTVVMQVAVMIMMKQTRILKIMNMTTKILLLLLLLLLHRHTYKLLSWTLQTMQKVVVRVYFYSSWQYLQELL